jgi:DegV family protein with EDD domain
MPIKPTALITDSTCDIPQNLADQYEIAIIPQVVVWGDEILLDRVEIAPLEFYHRMAKDPVLPTTTQPGPKDFERIYQNAIDQGAEEIVVFTVSSQLSGTYQLAKTVGDQMSAPVHVIDSKGPTLSLGWQVLTAARAREAGASVSEMIAAADEARQRMAQVVLMDSLDHLLRTGRIGKATQMLGSMISLKPLVKINHETGIIEPAGRSRTRKKAIDMLVQRFFDQLDVSKPMHIAVLHGNALPEAEALAERIQREYDPVELIINITGPVLGINTGPSALALAGFYED